MSTKNTATCFGRPLAQAIAERLALYRMAVDRLLVPVQDMPAWQRGQDIAETLWPGMAGMVADLLPRVTQCLYTAARIGAGATEREDPTRIVLWLAVTVSLRDHSTWNTHDPATVEIQCGYLMAEECLLMPARTVGIHACQTLDARIAREIRDWDGLA